MTKLCGFVYCARAFVNRTLVIQVRQQPTSRTARADTVWTGDRLCQEGFQRHLTAVERPNGILQTSR